MSSMKVTATWSVTNGQQARPFPDRFNYNSSLFLTDTAVNFLEERVK